MDEFKPQDELKPDASDRRPTRPRKSAAVPKVPVSRQHILMGVGILVLLLLVIGIGSALKSPDGSREQKAPAAQTESGSAGKSVDLSGSSSMSGQAQGSAVPAGGQQDAPQALSAPPIASTPTEAPQTPVIQNQQRVELPGDLNNALSNSPEQPDAAAQGVQSASSSLPVAPATVVAQGAGNHAAAGKAAITPHQHVPQHDKPAVAHHAATSKPTVKESKPAIAASQRGSVGNPGSTNNTQTSSKISGGNFTLQLSSASRSDSLHAWAKKQNLSGYHIYQTKRNGQPWYVLVSGAYATSAEAKRAVTLLPAEVRAQNPWVKPVSQVKKEANN